MIVYSLILVILLYLILIGSLVYGFDKIKEFKLQELKPKTKFSVVIPFRNEAKNLTELLDSIKALNYPRDLYEVLLVNDDSEDDSVEVIQEVLDTKLFRKNSTRTDIKIITNKRISNSPKKDAIDSAIAVSKHEWILTTDADCSLPKYWLDTFDEFIQNKSVDCVVAPVAYNRFDSFLKRFQALDFLSLQGATIGSFGLKKPFLCNGANFAYRKSTFKTVDGFKGNNNIASGDDIFLLEKFKTHDPEKVRYLKSTKAIVTTQPAKNLSDLIQQRLRWASKTNKTSDVFTKCVGFIIFISNLVCVLLIPLIVFNLLPLRIGLALFTIKFSIDFLLIFKTARFYKQELLLLSYISSSLLYPIFSVYIVLLSLIKPYRWKGRTFPK